LLEHHDIRALRLAIDRSLPAQLGTNDKFTANRDFQVGARAKNRGFRSIYPFCGASQLQSITNLQKKILNFNGHDMSRTAMRLNNAGTDHNTCSVVASLPLSRFSRLTQPVALRQGLRQHSHLLLLKHNPRQRADRFAKTPFLRHVSD
jgi:hypothetical protein